MIIVINNNNIKIQKTFLRLKTFIKLKEVSKTEREEKREKRHKTRAEMMTEFRNTGI